MRALIKKIRFSLRLIFAFFRKLRKLLFLGCLIGVLSFLLVPRFLTAILTKDIQKIGLVGRYTTSDLPLEIQQLIGEGLTEITTDGQIKPKLAQSWEINNDGREYIFVLRPNIFWHDGKMVKADDINYNFSDVKTTAIDSQKIKFELKQTYIPFLSVVSRPVFKKGLVGTGQYRVAKIKKKGEIVEKVVLVPKEKKSKSTKIYRFYPSEELARTSFKLGETDRLIGISQPKELPTWKSVEVTPEVKFDRLVAVFFNTQDDKLANKSFRQALAYAIDKRWQPRALAPIDPRSWAYNPAVKPYNLDLENAKKLLKKEDEVEPLKEIEFAVIPSLLGVAEEIKNDWAKLGIESKIRVISSLEEPFQALLITQEIPPDPDQYVFWHSTQEANLSRFKNPKIDKLLEEGRKTFDQEKRKQIYLDFQRFLVEDSPAVFLFHPTVYTLKRK